jgi:hypothetical protein
MSSPLNRWIYGLLDQWLALPIVGGTTLLPIITNAVVREVWSGNDPVIVAVTLAMAIVGYVLAWRGGRWLAHRAGSGADTRSAVLLSGAMTVWQLVKTGEGIPILLGSIVALSLPAIAMVFGAGYERRQAIAVGAGHKPLERPPSARRRFLIMCLISLALPGAIIMMAFAIAALPTTPFVQGMLGLIGLLLLVAAGWLLGRRLCRRWPWQPLHPAFGLVPALLSQWPLLLMAVELKDDLLAWAAGLFLLPILGFLSGFGFFRRHAA